MSTLIERSQQAAATRRQAREAYEAEQRERERGEAMDRTVRVLCQDWGIPPEQMTRLHDHSWSGVVEVEGLRFRVAYSRYDGSYIRRLVTCPDCGQLTVSAQLDLSDLASNVEAEQRGERWGGGRPVWIDSRAHEECPAHVRAEEPLAAETPPPPSLAEQLATLIRQIAAQEVERLVPTE